jgi:hypothetical protein
MFGCQPGGCHRKKKAAIWFLQWVVTSYRFAPRVCHVVYNGVWHSVTSVAELLAAATVAWPTLAWTQQPLSPLHGADERPCDLGGATCCL